eukprot:1092898-Rhodomonas_salina.2
MQCPVLMRAVLLLGGSVFGARGYAVAVTTEEQWYKALSAYLLATRSLVLTERMVLPVSEVEAGERRYLPTRCP